VWWHWIALGVFILAASIVSPLLARSWKPLLPTSLLIARVGDPGGNFTIDEMQALNARQLSPAEQAHLTLTLLDKRVRRDYFSPDEQRWLDGRVAAGGLAPDLLDRFYREMVEVWVVAPEIARVGEPFTVGVGLQEHRPLTTSCTPLVLVGGYWLDASTDRAGGSDVAEWTEDIGAEHRSFRRITRAKYPHEAALIAAEAGARTIHLEYWLLVMPRSSGAVSVTWGPDGKPVLPRGALFLERCEVSKTIHVAP
jgi:hypothetical protein